MSNMSQQFSQEQLTQLKALGLVNAQGFHKRKAERLITQCQQSVARLEQNGNYKQAFLELKRQKFISEALMLVQAGEALPGSTTGQIQGLIHQAQMATYLIQLPSEDVKWSRFAYDLIELPTTYEPDLKDFLSFFTTETRDRLRRAIIQVSQNGGSYDIQGGMINAKRQRIVVRILGQALIVDDKTVQIEGLLVDNSMQTQTEQALRRHMRGLAALSEITRSITGMTDLPSVLQLVSETMTLLFRVEETTITLFNETFDELVVAAHYASTAQQPSLRGYTVSITQQDPFFQLLRQKTSLVAQKDGLPLSNPEIGNIFEARHWQKTLRLPLTNRGDVLGLITVFSTDEDRDFSADEIYMAEAVAGQVAGIVGHARLFTEMKMTEDKLREAKDKAEEASVTKSLFLANTSHELRTPLNAIIGFSRMLENANLSPNHAENLRIIRGSAQHLLNLINQILDLSKLESGRMMLSLRRFDLESMLSELADMFRFKADKKQLLLNIEYAPDVPTDIVADEMKLRQVLINLIDNGLKFTKLGGVFVRVSKATDTTLLDASEIFESKDAKSIVWLLFEVVDTGLGISIEEMDKLFRSFVQTSTGRQSDEGTGLGLSISQQFVHLMGGDIQVFSPATFTVPELSHSDFPGTRFTFVIPVNTHIDVTRYPLKAKRPHTGPLTGPLTGSLTSTSFLWSARHRQRSPLPLPASLLTHNIPIDLIQQFETAVRKADYGLMVAKLAEMRPFNELLVKKLEELTDEFDYDTIIAIVKQVQK